MTVPASGLPSKQRTRRSAVPQLTGKVAPFPRAKFEKFLTHVKIRSRDYRGRIKFVYLGTQKYIIDGICAALERGVTTIVILKGRQIGASTILYLLDLFWAFEHEALLGTFVLHEDDALAKWRENIEVTLDSMPLFVKVRGKKKRFRPRVKKHNRDILSFGNDSSFSYLVAGTSENKGGGIGRSQAFNFVHATECAMYGNEEDVRTFKSSISDMYEHRLQVWESTANGFNHFHDMVQDAKTSPTMYFMFVGWWRDERKQFHVNDPRFEHYGTDRLSKLELGRVRAVKEMYGVTISMQQIAWYRWKLKDEFQNDQTDMDQEFPFTEDEAFQSGETVYYSAPVLNDVTREARRYPLQAFKYKLSQLWEDIEVIGPINDSRAELKVWEHASKFGVYIVSSDPAYGSSDKADNAVIQVWRAYAECIVQVAEFANRERSEHQLAWIFSHLAGFYGRKEVNTILEINGAGKSVLAEINHIRARVQEFPQGGDLGSLRNCFGNMRTFLYGRPDNVAQEFNSIHWVTTEDNKRMIMAGLKTGVELSRVHPRSLALIDEFRTLVNIEGSIEAGSGKNDDRVMCAALAYEYWRKWLWGRLRGEGLTRARSAQIEDNGGENSFERVVINYLKTCNIQVPA